MRVLIVFIFITAAQMTQAFELTESYDWDATFDPDKYAASKVKGEEATVIFDKTLFYYYAMNGGTRLGLKQFEHRLIWIEDESAIAKLNQVYLPPSATGFKARIINSKGEVVNFDKSKIEEITTDEGASSYQKLALPGIEPNSWVEVYYIMENINSNVRVTIDDAFSTSLAQVVFRHPVKWLGKFELSCLGFNGYEKNDDSIENELTIYEAHNIKAVGEESYAHDFNDSPRLDVSLNSRDWKYWSNLVESSLNKYHYKSFRGPVRKSLKTIINPEDSNLDKIIAIEKYLKENITKTEKPGQDYTHLVNKILKDKIATEDGIITTFMLLFREANIDFHLYLVGDEDYIDANPKFSSLRGMSDFLFYFPNEKVYMMPTNDFYYTGRIPNYLGNLHALRILSYIESDVINEREMLEKLPRAMREYNTETTSSLIQLNLEMEDCLVKLKKSYYGDLAIRSRGNLHFLDEGDKKDYLNHVFLSGMETTELVSSEIKNEDIQLNVMSKDSLHFIGKLSSDEIASSIPNGYILNISKPMGSQTSFYENEERHRDIFVATSRVYEHTIQFVIPDGYKVEGLENYIFNEEYKGGEGNEVVASFESTAEIKDGRVILTVYEFYEEGVYPKEDIEAYKKVINAAYEFYIAKIQLIKI